MGIIDIIVILVILGFALTGFKRGVLKELVIFVGTILMIILAFKLKNVLGDLMVKYLPFLNITNWGQGSALNVIVYQVISFILVMIIFDAIFNIIVNITNLFEKLLKATVVLGFFSKIGGFIVGLIEGYCMVFVLLFIVNLPIFTINIKDNSKFAVDILNSSPVFANYAKDTVKACEDVYNISVSGVGFDERQNRLVDTILKNNITSPEVLQDVLDQGKLKGTGVQEVINRYKK